MVSRSAPGHCAAACMRWTTAGSGPAMSMPHGQHIWPRKRGNNPAPARWLARRRRAAVLRLDIAAVVPSTARGLGPQGHTGHGADHWCECQAGAVRRDQPADCAPGRAHPSAGRRCRCPGILARATTPLPHRRHDLAARRPGQRTHRRAHPDAGRGARHPVSLATQAGSGAQRDGPTLARTEAAHRRHSTGRLGGCSGQRRRRLGAGTDTPAGAPPGRDDLEALLAQEPGRRLLATYLVQKEPEGFVFNRLQGALLREAYCLVRDGIASVEDIDRIVRDGLGLRWSVIGPFETADLNTRGGIASHAEKMGPAYARMGAERGQDDPWTPELVAQVEQERRARLPLDHWAERGAWRDRALMAMLECRRRHKSALIG